MHCITSCQDASEQRPNGDANVCCTKF